MDSSDDSFAWTNTSDDESDVFQNKMNNHDESECGKTYKKKVQKELFHNENGVCSNSQSETKELKAKKKKNKKEKTQSEPADQHNTFIKIEPESDLENLSKKKKKKCKSHEIENGDYCDYKTINEAIDDSFLNLKVKEEQTSIVMKSSKSIKRKLSETCMSNDISQTESDSQPSKKRKKTKSISTNEDILEDVNKRKSKKKKTICNQGENYSDLNNTVVEEKFYAEETIVQQPSVKKHQKSRSTNKLADKELKITSKEFIEDSDSDENSHGDPTENHQPTTNYDTPLTSPKRTCKISDRIQFEDEENSIFDISRINSNEIDENVVSSKLKQFMKTNKSLKLLTGSVPKTSVIGEDDEIWLLKCPSEFVMDNLEQSNITLDRKCKLKSGGVTYNGYYTESLNNIAFLSSEHGNYTLYNKQIQGSVTFHRRIPKAHFVKESQIVNNQTNFIPLPDTKSRHPLFGADYKETIKIPHSIAARLKMCHSDIALSIKKEKHKKSECNTKVENEMEIELVPKKHKKKKKRKHSDVDEVDSSVARPKKRKLVVDSSQDWENEQAIEENLFNC